MSRPFIDMHCDTLLRTEGRESSYLFDGEGMVNFKKMQQGAQMAQFFAVFFPQRITDEESFYAELTGHFFEQLRVHGDIIAQAKTYDDIIQNESLHKMSAILTIEDGRMVNDDMNRLHHLYDDGVRAIALTWNGENCFGFPNSTDAEAMRKGLTPFGKDAIAEMNDLGIMVDVSHLSDGGFSDVAALSKKPFVATHSNCRALCNHPRNLTDQMIRELAEKGGVSGLNFLPNFLTEKECTQDEMIDAMVQHVLHFINVGGEDCIALGTDFDGFKNDGRQPLVSSDQIPRLFDALQDAGLTERQLDKFARDNVLRVIRDVW